MAKDYNNFFDDLTDELADAFDRIMDRCGDEHPHYEQPVTPTCGGCDHYIRCDIPGHEDIGWCTLFEAFYESDNPFDECWEVD